MGANGETKRTKLTNESNEKVAQMNIDYQKEYNQQVFSREDNANQRAVADMRAAGLNPLANYAAAGAGGVAAAPQSTMHYETGNSKLQETLQALQAGTSIAESLQNQALGIQQMQQNDAAIKGQRLLNESQSLANQYDRYSLFDRVRVSRIQSLLSEQQFKKAQYDYDYRRYYGIHDGDDMDTIRAKIIAKNIINSDTSLLGHQDDMYYVGNPDGTTSTSYSAFRYADDADMHNLQQLISASYGEVSDKVMDLVKSLLSKSSHITNDNSTHYESGRKSYNFNK